jgi:transposase-like protein
VRRAVEKYSKKAPEFAKWLEDNIEEGLTVYQFPAKQPFVCKFALLP